MTEPDNEFSAGAGVFFRPDKGAERNQRPKGLPSSSLADIDTERPPISTIRTECSPTVLAHAGTRPARRHVAESAPPEPDSASNSGETTDHLNQISPNPMTEEDGETLTQAWQRALMELESAAQQGLTSPPQVRLLERIDAILTHLQELYTRIEVEQAATVQLESALDSLVELLSRYREQPGFVWLPQSPIIADHWRRRCNDCPKDKTEALLAEISRMSTAVGRLLDEYQTDYASLDQIRARLEGYAKSLESIESSADRMKLKQERRELRRTEENLEEQQDAREAEIRNFLLYSYPEQPDPEPPELRPNHAEQLIEESPSIKEATADRSEPPSAPEEDREEQPAEPAETLSLSDAELGEQIRQVLRGHKDADIEPEALPRLIASLQGRWLCKGENLRALLAACCCEQRQRQATGTTNPQAGALIPSWLCSIALQFSDTRARWLDDHLGELQQNSFYLQQAPASWQRFFLAWLTCGLLGRQAATAMHIVRALPPHLPRSLDHAREDPFFRFCIEKIVLPAQREKQPQLTPLPDPGDLKTRFEDKVAQADAIIDPARSNYRNTRVNRYWTALTARNGPTYHYLTDAKQGRFPSPVPTAQDVAAIVPDWPNILSEYRHNIINRLNSFLTVLREAETCYKDWQDRQLVQENVLGRQDITTAIEAGVDLLEVLNRNACPAAYPVRVVVERLRQATDGGEEKQT